MTYLVSIQLCSSPYLIERMTMCYRLGTLQVIVHSYVIESILPWKNGRFNQMFVALLVNMNLTDQTLNILFKLQVN